MDGLEDAIQLILDRTPDLAIEQLEWLSKEVEGIHKKVKSHLKKVHKSPSQPSQQGLPAVMQYLDNFYPKIEAMIEEGFPSALGVKNILAHDIAGAHRTPIAKARGALASLYLASAHNSSDEIGKARGEIPETRLETLLALKPGSTSFGGTMKHFIKVNSLDHIAHVSHSLSKVGYRLLYLLRCLRLDEDLLGLLLFCVGPLSHVKFGQLEELPKLLESYNGFANKNKGWLGRWLTSYRAEIRLDLVTLVPWPYQLRHPAIISVSYSADDLTHDHCTTTVQDRQSQAVRWRADHADEHWPTDSKHTSKPVLGAASADWLCGNSGRFSPTNLGFILRQIKVDEGGARKIPESSSRHYQKAALPPIRRDTDLDLASSRPAHKRSRY